MRTAAHLAASQGALRRFRRGLFPVYPLPPIRQLLHRLEVRLALVHYVH